MLFLVFQAVFAHGLKVQVREGREAAVMREYIIREDLLTVDICWFIHYRWKTRIWRSPEQVTHTSTSHWSTLNYNEIEDGLVLLRASEVPK